MPTPSVDVSYDFKQLPFGKLEVPYYEDVPMEVVFNYQRKQQRVEDRIVEAAQRNGGKVNPDLFGALTINRRDDGEYVVVDGGTRVRALERLDYPDSAKVPCFMHNWTLEEEINNYLALNSERMGFGQVDKFIARVKRGDRDAVAIQRILEDVTGKGIGSGKWQCVNALELAYSAGVLPQVTEFIVNMRWMDGGMNQAMVNAVRWFYMQEAFQPPRALSVWHGMPARSVIAAGKNQPVDIGQSRSIYKGVVRYLAPLYNSSKPRLSRAKRMDWEKLVGPKAEPVNGDE